MQSVMPGYVATNMTRMKQSSIIMPSAETYVQSAVATIGVDSVTFGYWPHWLMMTAYSIVKFLNSSLHRKILLMVALKRKATKTKQ